MGNILQKSYMPMAQSYWQSNSFNIMIDKLDATCEQYGMEMNASKTNTMIVEKTSEKQCEVIVKGQGLQKSRNTYTREQHYIVRDDVKQM